MSDKHLRRYPQHVGRANDWWFYEEPNGLTVVVEIPERPARIVIIPWRNLRAAVARKDTTQPGGN